MFLFVFYDSFHTVLFSENSESNQGFNFKGPSSSNVNLLESSSVMGIGNQGGNSASSLPSYNLSFLLQDQSGKLAKNHKRHYESQVGAFIILKNINNNKTNSWYVINGGTTVRRMITVEWTPCRTATLLNVVDETSRRKPVSKTCVETCGKQAMAGNV